MTFYIKRMIEIIINVMSYYYYELNTISFYNC